MKKLVFLFALVSMLFSFSTSSYAKHGENVLREGEFLWRNEYLESSNGRYMLAFMITRLELYDAVEHKTLWQADTSSAYQGLEISPDGKVSSIWAGQYLWQSNNQAWSNAHYQGNPPANLAGDTLVVQDDGNLVLYNTKDPVKGWYPVWAK
ncbi:MULTISPECIES: hypothetical protein [Paenibacillus]|uniref:hypothetical protein n=1 Tax=Paenibacillus TaxID=44249 RepID=UPI0022B914E5|nr:hypothetical protein [Paenibacillus caseinilyticus]MCZ8518396.1 hypothetical protein [Paenibacillus caseinilyticus]